MLSSQQPHPSPPTVIAVSNNSNILLSASPAPPTIYIQDRRWGGSAPVNFQPSDAQTPVTCAEFQGPREKDEKDMHFVLGFQDGRVVLYHLSIVKRRNHHFQLQPVKVGAIMRLHKATMRGVSAMKFIPGYAARIVCIGYDGRCRLVDFEGGGKVLRTWYVDGEASCLSVCPGARVDGMDGEQTLIAVGTNAGKIEIFNVLGLLVHEVDIDGPVIALEWVGDMCRPCVLPSRISPASLESSPGVTEEGGIVKRSMSRSIHPSPLPIGCDLFSQYSNVSPRKRNSAPSRQALIRTRPRILTETFTAPPPVPLPNIQHPSSSSPSSQSSSQSDQEFFTPPSTQQRRDKPKPKAKAKPPSTPPSLPDTPYHHISSATKTARWYSIGNADGAGSAKSPPPLRPRHIERTSTPTWLIPRPASRISSGYRPSKRRERSDSYSTDSSTAGLVDCHERYVDGPSKSTRSPRHSASVELGALFVQQAKLRRDVAALRQELEEIKQDLIKSNSGKAKRRQEV
jgi:hypothetical protein